MVNEYNSKFPLVYCITWHTNCSCWVHWSFFLYFSSLLAYLPGSCQPVLPLHHCQYLLSMTRFKFEKQPSSSGSTKSLMNFEFTEFYPVAFWQIRETLGMGNPVYLKSMTHYLLCEMGSAGKSGSFFYKSLDSRYIIKSMKEDEGQFLLGILLDYFLYMQQNPNSLLTRYLGLYSLRVQEETSTHSQVIHFVVMDNVLPHESLIPIHEKYDLKGSSVDRLASKAERAKGANAILKDQDMLQRGIFLGPQKRKLLFDQLFSDCMFLQERGIMDYSFFIGIHVLNNNSSPPSGSSDRSIFRSENYCGWFSTTKDNLPRNEVYYFGIIDMLQPYNLRKQIENSVKSLFENPDEISCVEPVKYSFRFQSYLKKITNMFSQV